MFPILEFSEPSADDKSARAASLRSRLCVHAGDKDAWLALFAPDAVVQDPYGVSPLDPTGEGHRGHDAIGAFWDMTIGPNDVHIDLGLSNQCENHVANLMTITTTFPDGQQIIVDAMTIYRVNEDGLITSLRAYWELEKARSS